MYKSQKYNIVLAVFDRLPGTWLTFIYIIPPGLHALSVNVILINILVLIINCYQTRVLEPDHRMTWIVMLQNNLHFINIYQFSTWPYLDILGGLSCHNLCFQRFSFTIETPTVLLDDSYFSFYHLLYLHKQDVLASRRLKCKDW